VEELLAASCVIAPLTGSGIAVSFAILTLVFVALFTAINSLIGETLGCEEKRNLWIP
jgi:nucleoside permease NupC